MKRLVLALIPLAVALPLMAQSWPQWAQNPQHTGFLNVKGQDLKRTLADVIFDPLVADELATGVQQFGPPPGLLVHYQVPLVDGNDVYMESKSGQFTRGTYSSQNWHQNKFTWVNGQLTKVWTFDSDWIAPGSQGDFWEPVYHAVLANGFLYDPGQGGTIFKLNKADGTVITRINPFNKIDPNIYTVSPLTADGSGNIYYNALQLKDNGPFYSSDAVDSWLIKVAPDDSISMVSYTGLNPAAPAATDLCLGVFSNSQLPWPPSAAAVPPSVPCGLQRVGLNIAPAIAPDGTIYTLTRAHFLIGARHSFLLALNPNLTLKWATSLRNRFHDGCGVAPPEGTLPPNGQPGGCRDLGTFGNAAILGNDPAQNTPGAGRVLDDESSCPTVAPDGSIFFGAYSRYNYAQGHLMHFSANGDYLGAFGFGWDSTPAIFQHDGTYSVVIKNNHYSGLGSYCNNNATFCPLDRTSTNPASPEEFFVTQLSPNLIIEWSFKNTNTQSCTRNADGSISCVSDHPNSFEWCVNAPVVDKLGVVYANSEDGNLYAINQGGTLKQNLFQLLALGAAYTPTSLGGDGKIYSENAGHLFVVGK
ncbi:MAG TPA: hypothetical protein VF962_14030 [Gemmatimonadaceae bacterium]